MRVLHVIPSISPGRGGPTTVLRELTAGLAEQGIEVAVAATDDDGPGHGGAPPARDAFDHRVALHVFPRRARFYSLSPALSGWLRGQAPTYDLVHVHALFSHPSTAAARAASRRGVPYIVRPLGTLGAWEMAHGDRLLKAASLRLVERRLLAGAAVIQYTSERERAEAETRVGRLPSVVIPNPVQPAAQRLPGEQDAAVAALRRRYPQLGRRVVVASLSRLDPKKGVEMLLAGARLAVDDGADLVLLIAGRGEPGYEEQLRAEVTRLGLEDRVVWCGLLEGAAKAELVSGADVSVLVSHSENFGVSAAESMAAGVPVVVSDAVGLAPDVASRGAGLVVRRDAREIGRALLSLATDPSRRAAAGVAARALASERYSRAAVAAAVAEVYAQVISSARTANGFVP